MQAPSCSVVQLCNGSPTAVVFGTNGQGVPPCHLQVLDSGAFAIEDALGVVWTLNNKLVGPTGNGVLAAGQTLAQVTMGA